MHATSHSLSFCAGDYDDEFQQGLGIASSPSMLSSPSFSIQRPAGRQAPLETTREGWLCKVGSVRKNWKRRYFCLTKKHGLIYYADLDFKKSLGMVEVKGSEVLTEYERNATGGRDFVFGLFFPKLKREYLFQAENEKDKKDWIQKLAAEGAMVRSEVVMEGVLEKCDKVSPFTLCISFLALICVGLPLELW